MIKQMPGKQVHILIIDDNEDILFMLEAMLKIKGYKVTVKKNTDNIETAVTKINPGVIIMDMLLSGADGREICRQLKANTVLEKIPVIMISAHPEAKTHCLNAGANYFVEKPFEMTEILQTVANAAVK
jgi:DNA-binding response OmpR family regulator